MSAPPRIREVEWERPPLIEPLRDEELERWARREGQPSVYPLRFFSRCPWLARSMVQLSSLELAHLDHDLADVVVMVVSRDNSCRYCYAGASLLLRLIGMSEAQIEILDGDLVAAELEPRRRLGLDFARRLSRCNPPPSAVDVRALSEAGFSREALLELAFTAIQYVVVNRVVTLAALPPERAERLDRGWVAAVLRPLAARMMRKRRVRRPAVFLSPEQRSGPFAAEVTALDGLPAGRKLWRILDEAWSSTLLTPRAKALVFAVVARGLGAERVESEALELLAAEGLERAAADEVLAHLASPALDSVESAAVPFVRETLWYEPAPLQRGARALRAALGEERLLEVIGLAAFANGICRLSTVLAPIAQAPGSPR